MVRVAETSHKIMKLDKYCKKLDDCYLDMKTEVRTMREIIDPILDDLVS